MGEADDMGELAPKKLKPSPPPSTPPPHVLLKYWRGEEHKMASKQLSSFLAHVGDGACWPMCMASPHGLLLGGWGLVGIDWPASILT